jgi:hypothetical protein
MLTYPYITAVTYKLYLSGGKQYPLPKKHLYTKFHVLHIKFKKLFNMQEITFLNIRNGTIHRCFILRANISSVTLHVNSFIEYFR